MTIWDSIVIRKILKMYLDLWQILLTVAVPPKLFWIWEISPGLLVYHVFCPVLPTDFLKQSLIWKLFYSFCKVHYFDRSNYMYHENSHKNITESENVLELLSYPVLELLSYFSCYNLFCKHNFETGTKQIRNVVTPSQAFLKDFHKVLVIPCWLLLELFDHQGSTSKSKAQNGNFRLLSKPAVFYTLANHTCLHILKMNFHKI